MERVKATEAASRLWWFSRFRRAKSSHLDDDRATSSLETGSIFSPKLDGSRSIFSALSNDIFSDYDQPPTANISAQAKSLNRKAAIIAFFLSLSIAASISLVAVLASKKPGRSDQEKIEKLSSLIMKLAALGNLDQAHAMLRAAQTLTADPEGQAQIQSLKSFIAISSVLRKVERWQSAGKFELAEKMLEKLRKLNIPNEEIDFHKAIEHREMKFRMKVAHQQQQGSEVRVPPSPRAFGQLQPSRAGEWVGLLSLFHNGDRKTACLLMQQSAEQNKNDLQWHRKLQSFLKKKCSTLVTMSSP